jgi:phospholipid transport system substrate-binding protein
MLSSTTRALSAALAVALSCGLPQSALAGSARHSALAAATAERRGSIRPRRARESDSALAAFKAVHRKVQKLVEQKASSRRLQKHVDALLDYDWIAGSALGGPTRAEQRCQPRCEDFKALLAELIRANYLKLVRMSDRRSVEYLGEVRRKKSTKVKTRVRFTKDGHERVRRVTYVMHRVDDSWQVRDIIIQGASLARNYRYEFNRILRDQGIDGLLLHLQNKLDSFTATNK